MQSLILQLIREGEGPRLDYESTQYVIANATDEQKSELVKDVLAMANAYRLQEAFIMTGVLERPGKIAEVVGVSSHLDDASLQQIVNAKTNRPVQFTYSEVAVADKTVGLVRIPPQQRPIFLRSAYGRPSKAHIRTRRSRLLADD